MFEEVGQYVHMNSMARLELGSLREAWAGEATHFTPFLAAQLDLLGDEIGIDLQAVGEVEVASAGGRSIDIVSTADDGSEFIIENQYGTLNHDHLTRGLAYAIARGARGLVLVAEGHRDEFRAVAEYLNNLAELDEKNGVRVWLVEAKAARIGESAWAPLFRVVVSPNEFTRDVERAKSQQGRLQSLTEFWQNWEDGDGRDAARSIVDAWKEAGHFIRLIRNHLVLEAAGPSAGGRRSVISIYDDGSVQVPFHSYAGANSGISVDALTTVEFRGEWDSFFGFRRTQKLAATASGWLQLDVAEKLIEFCLRGAIGEGSRDGGNEAHHLEPGAEEADYPHWRRRRGSSGARGC